MSIDMRGKPFYLEDTAIQWVEKTLSTMSLEEKIGQLFFLVGFTTKSKELEALVKEIHPGGVMYRTAKASKVLASHTVLQSNSKIPLFLAANLESGGEGLIDEGTFFGHQMLIAATDDETHAYRLGVVCGKEAASVGGNMAFAPILDLNYNFRNPITNIRSFGDHPERVARMGAAYIKGTHESNVCTTIKHFPGDGLDGRDQHLVTTYNTMTHSEWRSTYGIAFKGGIDAGSRGVMIGHIGLPKYFDYMNDSDNPLRELPASLNPVLIQDLLRDELGFNGLTITDASLMTGFGVHGKRSDLVPAAVAAGCDMFLFTRLPIDDYNAMMMGYKNGILTEVRLNEAVTRILATKASMKMHLQTQETRVPKSWQPPDQVRHRQWSKEAADQAITLVRDDEGLLPLDPQKSKKIGVIYSGNPSSLEIVMKNLPGVKGLALRGLQTFQKVLGKAEKVHHEKLIDLLNARGFQAFHYDFGDIFKLMKESNQPLSDWSKKFDVIIYLTKWEPMSNQTSLQMSYKAMGFDAPWFVNEVPTVLVSIANPYHGYDLPMIKTVINGYSPTDGALEAIADKLTGHSPFKGISPVQLTYEAYKDQVYLR